MKLFKGAPEAAAPPAPATPTTPTAPPAVPGAAPEGAHAQDLDAKLAVAVDKSVRDIAEKLAKLSSSVETVREERQQFDEKLGKMEDRMRKLTALAEMISTQYNPFLGTQPPVAGSAVASVQPDAAAQLAAEVGAAPPVGPAPDAPAWTPARPEGPSEDPAPWAGRAEDPVSWESVSPAAPGHSFQESMTLLQWSEMLLRAAGRDGLPDLLDYYSSLGWIGDDLRQLLATYAKGLQVDSDGRGDWRARVDLHEKSLVFVEKLRPRRR